MTAEERLKAAKAAREALRVEREAKAEAARLEREADAEERALADETALDAAEREHGEGRVAGVETAMGLVIVKRPHSALYRRFVDAQKATVTEFEKLVLPNVVYPSKERVESILEEQPAVLSELASAVCRLAGAKLEIQSGK